MSFLKRIIEECKNLKLESGEVVFEKRDSPLIVAEFRKVNCIVDFFEMHYGEEVENCEYFAVSKAALDDLAQRVEAVLASHDRASELLPTTEGFFFGNTDYNEHYFDDLKDLKAFLDSDVVQDYDEDETQMMLFCWW